MTEIESIWLASYPRSGNTYLRTILFHCFGLRSGSVYPDDVSDVVAGYVGHIEPAPGAAIDFGAQPIQLVKTHEPPRDTRRAIYVLRDGRAATASMWEFFGRKEPLEGIIRGLYQFPTWTGHLALWQPRTRAGTLFLRYEDLVADLPGQLRPLADFLGLEPQSETLPAREKLVDGQWIRRASDWRTILMGRQLRLFNEINGAAMADYGYQ